MADTNTNPTQIAQHLTRIETARNILRDKAVLMGLYYEDPEEGAGSATPVTAGTTIDRIADAYEQIPFWPDDESGNPTGITVSGKSVQVNKGYYPEVQSVAVDEAQREKPTISVNASDGKITATVHYKTGFVLEGYEYEQITVTHTNLKAENIKDGTKIFGIEGTFTSDGSMTSTVGTGGNYESDQLLEGCIAYVKGKKIHGTLPNMSGETIVYYDPVTEDFKSPITSRACVSYLTIRLKSGDGCLLDRLSKI